MYDIVTSNGSLSGRAASLEQAAAILLTGEGHLWRVERDPDGCMILLRKARAEASAERGPFILQRFILSIHENDDAARADIFGQVIGFEWNGLRAERSEVAA